MDDVMSVLDEDYEGGKTNEVYSEQSVQAIMRWFNANLAQVPP